MASITCPCSECKWNGQRNNCKAKHIDFTYRNMATVNEGRVDMWVCKQYEMDEDAAKIVENFERFLQERRRDYI